MRIDPEISGASIILLGNFNPAIFSPAWFVHYEVLPESTIKNANVEIATSQISMFSTEWLHIQVHLDRFQASTVSAPIVRIQDLVVQIFKQHLPHTPLTAIGINRDVHFRAHSQEARDRVGRLLAPVEPWGEVGDLLNLDGSTSGMVSLTMRQEQPSDRALGGQINVKVEPSARIGEGRTGIYVQVNDHYVLDPSEIDARDQLINVVEEKFESSCRRSEKIIDYVMSMSLRDAT